MGFEKFNILKECEDIVVIVVNVANAAEIPFEVDCKSMLEMYREFLSECFQIMQEESCCIDVIVYNNCVCGVFKDANGELLFRSMFIAMQIHNLIGRIKRTRDNLQSGNWVLGIGIAFGKAVRISLTDKTYHRKAESWLGTVFDRAYNMAQKASRDGRSPIMVSK